MLKVLLPFKSVVSLVPKSGIQFLDFGLALDALKTRKAFWEQRGGSGDLTLRCLYEQDGEQVYWDADARRIAHPDPNSVYEINKVKALEPFLNKWVPLPFLRLDSGGSGPPVFAAGPANWVRVFVVELPEREEGGTFSHRVVLAVDTTLVERLEGDPYLAPASTDSGTFGFAPGVDDNGWLLSEPWFDAWLRELFLEKEQARRSGRPLREEELDIGARHWALYLAFLQVLDDAALFPRLCFIDVAAAARFREFIDVDFVLDIGNSRTCGLLIESTPDSPSSLKDSYVLELRNLTRPERVCNQPFASSIEFSKASFGRDALSRESGRVNAFSWPSVVRVGPEAQALAAQARGTEGATGQSSPKRYLWDDRPTRQVWRFSGSAQADGGRQPPVSGPILGLVTDAGDVLSLRPGRGTMAIRPNFARGSLYSFMLCEILMQAVSCINSVGNRSIRKHELSPRRLRRIILTLPPAMPVAEQKRLKERAQAAVRLLQDLWGDQGPITVVSNLDEATSTQLVHLYDQITTCFRGDAEGYFALQGKHRPAAGPGPSLRVASIDIGGGTTDLSIMTYSIIENRMLMPVQEFREGFRLAGDDVVETVVMRQVLPAIAGHLEALGVPNVRQLVLGLFTGLGTSEPERQARRQFVANVLAPMAIRLLHEYESWTPLDRSDPEFRPFDWFFPDGAPAEGIQDYLSARVRAAGVRDFSLSQVSFPVDGAALDEAVVHTLDLVLSNLSEVIHAYDCDLVLLAGRPSRFPAVTRMLLAQLPVTPDRVVAMHKYAVGVWYPYRDVLGCIHDPKTTAAVGAMLCTLAEGQLEAFMLQSSRFQMKSTARFIGELEANGQLLDSHLLFSDIDLDRRPGGRQPAGRTLRFFTKVFLGYRQLGLERWPAAPLYQLEFRHPENARRFALPLRVTLERADIDEDDRDAEAKKEDFRIVDIEQSEGSPVMASDIVLRLQTLRDEDGYWLDTGRLDNLPAAFSAIVG